MAWLRVYSKSVKGLIKVHLGIQGWYIKKKERTIDRSIDGLMDGMMDRQIDRTIDR